MQVTRLSVENFRGIGKAELYFSGHTLLVGGNNVGKSTICEALDLVLGPDRLYRKPPVEEFDFRNAKYLADDHVTPLPIRIEVILTGLTEEIMRLCRVNLELWHKSERRLLATGEIKLTDDPSVEFCLRLVSYAGARQALDAALAQDQLFAGSDDLLGIHVMTIHKSKAKEFDAVVIFDDPRSSPLIYCPEAAPFPRSRKLLRVGITRAKHHVLVLSDVSDPSLLLRGHHL